MMSANKKLLDRSTEDKLNDKLDKDMFLDFEDVSGGVEVKPAEVRVQKTPVQPVTPVTHKHDYRLPIRVGDETVIMNLRDVDGDQFLAWAESVYAPLCTQRLDPDLYDGVANLDNRKVIVNAIAKFYEETLIRRGHNVNILN